MKLLFISIASNNKTMNNKSKLFFKNFNYSILWNDISLRYDVWNFYNKMLPELLDNLPRNVKIYHLYDCAPPNFGQGVLQLLNS